MARPGTPLLALAVRPTALGPPGVAQHRRRGGRGLLLRHRQCLARDLLRRRGTQHVGELARLLLRLLRPLGHHLGGQTPGLLLAAGALGPHLRLSHLGLRPAPGHRGNAHRPGALPRRAPGGRSGRRLGGGAGPGCQPGHRPLEPGQHLGHPAHPAAGPGGRRHHQRDPVGPLANPPAGRRLRRPGLPGQDVAGLAGAARLLPGLPAGRSGGVPLPAPWSHRALRAGRARGVAQLDVGRHLGAGARPALCGRQL